MKNQLITISKEDADRYTFDYFINICGFRNKEGEKYKRLLDHGMKIRDRVIGSIELKAVVSSYDGDIISGNTARIGNTVFTCNAFEQLNPESIRKVYLYIFTSGSYDLNDKDPVIDQLYADIWGTAYTDAGLEVLRQHLKNDFDNTNCPCDADRDTDKKTSILDPFGPGFYGMDVDQVGKFFEVLDGEKIGVRARTNSLMLPLKSCAGFYVVVDDGSKLPRADCKSCRADHKGCEYCQAVIKNF